MYRQEVVQLYHSRRSHVLRSQAVSGVGLVSAS
jgi:hypothetical protein